MSTSSTTTTASARGGVLLASIALLLGACDSASDPISSETLPGQVTTTTAPEWATGESDESESSDKNRESDSSVRPAGSTDSDSTGSDGTDSDGTDSDDTDADDTDADDTGSDGTGSGGSDPATPSDAGEPASGETSECSPSQHPGWVSFTVVGIAADDPDGGLVLRSEPGPSGERRTVLPAGSIAPLFFPHVPEDSSVCQVLTSDGSIWFKVHEESAEDEGVIGWANSAYLSETSLVPGPDADVHADCVYLPDAPDTCIGVYTSGGEIRGLDDPLTEDLAKELHYACNFQGYGQACELIAADAATAAESARIRAELAMTPTNELVTVCGSTGGIDRSLACMELYSRP